MRPGECARQASRYTAGAREQPCSSPRRPSRRTSTTSSARPGCATGAAGRVRVPARPCHTGLSSTRGLISGADSTSAPMPARMPRPSFQSWKQHDSTPGYTRRQRRRFPVPAAPQSATAGKRSASSPWPRSTWAPPSTSGRRSRRCRPPAVPCPWTTSKAAPARRATCPPRGRRGR